MAEIAAIANHDRAPSRAHAASLLTGSAGNPSGYWIEGSVALVWTGTAEVSVSEDLVVVVDARLDNQTEFAGLARADASASVADLIAQAWRRAGSQMLDWVVGELAAIVLERRTGRLHGLRDLCAGRPLHITHDARGWAVASEWRPLVARHGRRAEPDPVWFAAAFVGHSFEPQITPYAGVEMVIPGYVAATDSSGWRQSRAAQWHVPRLTDERPGAYAEAFRDLFDAAVRCRIDGAGRIGVNLSGGLDSTSVLVSARAVRPELGMAALCVPLRERAGDERIMQAHVAERTGSDLHWVEINSHGPLGSDGPEAVFEEYGAPPLTVNWYFGEALAEYARATGVRAVMDGEDGDGSLGGSLMYFADLLLRGRWAAWLREANALRALSAASGRDLLIESLYMAAPPRLRRAYLRRHQLPPVPAVLADAVAERLDLRERLAHTGLNRTWAPGHAFRLAQTQVGAPEQIGPILTTISEPWRRRGVALTHPWSDRRLMSFCMGLPFVHVHTEALGKIVLRQAMAGRLPPGLLVHRGKADLSEVARRALTGRQRPYVKEGLRLARSRPDWFTPGAVAEIETSFDAGEALAPAARVAMFAWWLRWCEHD